MSDLDLNTEMAKLVVKMDMVCKELTELKEFTRTALQRLAVFEERIRHLEEWRDDIINNQKLRMKFSYDLRSALAGGFAGGGISLGVSLLLKMVGVV